MSRAPLPPTILVILGATGDLTHRKIIPALANLHKAGVLPAKFRVVGFSRRELSDGAFRGQFGEDLDRSFLELLSYQQGLFDRDEDYAALARRLQGIDDEWGLCTNKLFYLAVPPLLYGTIATHLAKSGLTIPCDDQNGWTRIIVEKPFGNDAKTAEDLDALLGKLFKEEQIYRLDHYLGKEMMQNILTFRFANNVFESNWNNRRVESIAVRFLEKLGVEDRGDFYDDVGALRDVGQNHLLQMLALTTMENPLTLEADPVRRNRTDLLKTLRPFSPQDVRVRSLRAQYDGYRTEHGVAANSETETYFKLTAFLDGPRWQGVPITLEAGKAMAEVKKEIEVVFKHPTPCLCPPGIHYKNSVLFRMEPQEGITVRFWGKEPGLETMKIEEQDFQFAASEESRARNADAYGKILLDCISGDQMLFVSSAEVAASWKFIDTIENGWRQGLAPLHRYERGQNPANFHPLGENANGFARGSDAERTLGIMGLGKMGGNLARQLMEKGWKVIGWNRSPEVVQEMEGEGMTGAASPDDLLQKLSVAAGGTGVPRVVWLMVPAGQPVDDLLFGVGGIAAKLHKGDIVVDGGNSFYKDSGRRAARLAKMGIHFLDAGVSGGPGGARRGATVMVGGEKKIYDHLVPLFRDMSVPDGYAHFGKAGAGHFVKMVHNGIEYGMMQSLAEGFAIMKKSPFKPDLQEVARLYNHGSVIESRLVGWLEKAYAAWGDDLKGVSGSVGATGEGEWTAKTGRELGIPTPAITDAFKFRQRSQKNPSYIGQILSALRNQFGGHAFRADHKDAKKSSAKKPAPRAAARKKNKKRK